MIVTDPNKFVKPMAQAILELYYEVIVKLEKVRSACEAGPINEELASNVTESVPNNTALRKLIPEYLKFESAPSKWAF